MSKKKLKRLVRVLAHLMSLEPRWKLTVKFDEELDSAAAVSTDVDYLQAEITLNPGCMRTRADAVAYIAHELMHVQLSPLTKVAGDLAGERGKAALVSLEEMVLTEVTRWRMWKSL